MAVFGVAAFVVVVGLSWVLYVMGVRYAAERTTVERPDGARFDVLVNRTGVMLYTSKAAVANLYSAWPVLVGLARNRRWKSWRWAVTVRQAPFAGYPNLVHEIFDDRQSAQLRASDLAEAIETGARFWSAELEM